jgi:DNA-binding transcriptional ArsR family regulator
VPPSRPNLLDPHLVRALAHPLRVQILEVLNERRASPNELMEMLSYPLGNVAYHTRVLEKCGCIEMVATERRRGAVEHFFRAKPRSYIGHQDWRRVPRSVRNEVSGASLEAFIERVIGALEAGTIDDRDDTTLSWTTMAVDELGWTQAAEVLGDAMARLQAVHEQSRERLEISGEAPMPIVTGVAAFEAARPAENEQ